MGKGGVGLILAGAVALLLVALSLRQGHWIALGSLLVTTWYPPLSSLPAVRLGSISLWWPDLALLLLIFTGTVSIRRMSSDGRKAVRMSAIFAAPVVIALSLKVVSSISDGMSFGAIGSALRGYAWFAAMPAFAATVRSKDDFGRVAKVTHFVGLSTALVLVAGSLSHALGSMLAQLTGVNFVSIPSYSGTLGRLYLPGRTVFPVGLGLALGARVYGERSDRAWRDYLMVIIYAAGTIMTFGRGAWLALVASLLVVLSARVSVRVLVVSAATVFAAITLVLAADAMIGKTAELPNGVGELVIARIGEMGGGDANTGIRLLEDREALKSAASHPLIGVGLMTPLGVYMGETSDGLPLYSVHNGYLAFLGRFGLVGFVPLLWMLGALVACSLQLLRRAQANTLVWAFALSIGLLRNLFVSWTQPEIADIPGVVSTVLAGGLLLTLLFATPWGDESRAESEGGVDEPA